MLRIALCDDEDVFLKFENEIVSEYLKQKGLSFRIECFSTGESLLKDKVQLDTFDLVILDVEMTGLDGISVAKAIRANNTIHCYIIYILKDIIHINFRLVIIILCSRFLILTQTIVIGLSIALLISLQSSFQIFLFKTLRSSFLVLT